MPLPCAEVLSWSRVLPLLAAEIVSLQSQRPSLKSKPWFRLTQILQIARLSHTLAVSGERGSGWASCLPLFPTEHDQRAFLFLSFFSFFKFETGPHNVADAGLGYSTYSQLPQTPFSLLSFQTLRFEAWVTCAMLNSEKGISEAEISLNLLDLAVKEYSSKEKIMSSWPDLSSFLFLKNAFVLNFVFNWHTVTV